MMFFYSETKKIKCVWDSPPPKKGAGIRTVTNMATCTYACLYQQPVTWIFTGSILSDSALCNYKVIRSSKIIIQL